MKLSGKWTAAVLVTVAVGVGAGIYVYRQFFYLRKFHIVEDGVLFRSATMPSESAQRRIFSTTGTKTVVILRSEKELGEEDWYERECRIAKEFGVAVKHIAMNYDTPPTKEQLAELMRLVDDPTARPVLIHCEVGVIRTGMMAAAYRMERNGATPEQACKEYEAIAGSHAENPKRAHVKEWILNYRPQFPKPK